MLRRAALVPVLVGMVVLAACSEDSADPTVPTSGAAPATTSVAAPTTTSPPVPIPVDSPSFDELPDATVAERFTIDLTALGLEDSLPVVATEEGLWFLRGRQAVIVLADGTVEPVDLPVDNEDVRSALVVDGVVWVPSSTVDGGRYVLRFDPATREAAAFPAAGPVARLAADPTTVWAERADTIERTIEGWTDDGSIGTGLVAGEPAGDDPDGSADLDSFLLPTRAGVYDCLFGSWGYTPVGGSRVADLATGTGCNTVPVDDGYLIVDAGGLAVLRGGERVAVTVSTGFDPDWSCDGPAQQGDRVLALCGDWREPRVLFDVDLASSTAVAVGGIGVPDPPVAAGWQPEDVDPVARLDGPGLFAVVEVQTVTADADDGVVIGWRTADGTVVWQRLALPSIAGVSTRLVRSGGSLWIVRHDGNPGTVPATWSEVLPPT